MEEQQKSAMLVLKSSLEGFLEESSQQAEVIENLIKTLSEDTETVALSANKLLECCGQYMQDVGNYASGNPDEMLKQMCGVFGTIKLIEVLKDEVAQALNNTEEADGE